MAAALRGRLLRRGARAAAAAAYSVARGAPPPLPVVYHPLYSAPQLAPGHRFPMQAGGPGRPCARRSARAAGRRAPSSVRPRPPHASPLRPTPAALCTLVRPRRGAAGGPQVFGRIYERLLRRGEILESQVHVPPRLPTDDELALVHCPDYLRDFSGGALDAARTRRHAAAARRGAAAARRGAAAARRGAPRRGCGLGFERTTPLAAASSAGGGGSTLNTHTTHYTIAHAHTLMPRTLQDWFKRSDRDAPADTAHQGRGGRHSADRRAGSEARPRLQHRRRHAPCVPVGGGAAKLSAGPRWLHPARPGPAAPRRRPPPRPAAEPPPKTTPRRAAPRPTPRRAHRHPLRKTLYYRNLITIAPSIIKRSTGTTALATAS
jgi:hypothetical protein